LLKFDRRAPASALIENSVGMISENCSTVCVHKRSLSDVVYITVRIDMATIPMSAVSMISLNSYTNRDVCNAKPKHVHCENQSQHTHISVRAIASFRAIRSESP
jgi:hypothetical protein